MADAINPISADPVSEAVKAAAINAAVDGLTDLSLQEVVAMVGARQNLKLAEAERAKTHPMTAFALPDKEWQDLKAHLLDGGGVTDDRDLAVSLLQSILDDNQGAFWPLLIQLVKTRAKITGKLRPLPFGGISLTGAGPVV